MSQPINQGMEWIRQSMALNNAGVSLLEKGCVNKALQTFDLLSYSIAQAGSDAQIVLTNALVQVEAALSLDQPSENGAVQVSPVVDQGEEMYSASLYGNASVLSPLLLRDDVADVDMTTAIYIMAVARYNHGIALRCGFANKASSQGGHLLMTAEQSFRTAKMLLWQNKEKLKIGSKLKSIHSRKYPQFFFQFPQGTKTDKGPSSLM